MRRPSRQGSCIEDRVRRGQTLQTSGLVRDRLRGASYALQSSYPEVIAYFATRLMAYKVHYQAAPCKDPVSSIAFQSYFPAFEASLSFFFSSQRRWRRSLIRQNDYTAAFTGSSSRVHERYLPSVGVHLYDFPLFGCNRMSHTDHISQMATRLHSTSHSLLSGLSLCPLSYTTINPSSGRNGGSTVYSWLLDV